MRPGSLTPSIVASLVALAAVAATVLLTGCTDPATPAADNPNAGLFRDFLDGKFDSAGHPLNARVTAAVALCGSTTLPASCEGPIAGGAQQGDLVASARIRVTAHAASGDVVKLEVVDGDAVVAHDTLTVSRVRDTTSWLDLHATWTSVGHEVRVRLALASGAKVELQSVEVFPQRFGLALSPGSGVLADTDHLVIELPRGRKVDKAELDGTDVTAPLAKLLTVGKAQRMSTTYRTLVEVGVGDLAPARGDVAELRVHSNADAARMQLRRTPPACTFEGDPAGKKVLITGFQPFPADGWHDNISGVAVTALDPSTLHGARVMRIVMPVEYDRSAAEVTDAIARCHPEVVISFGQGGDAIALEEVAYNLQDTGEVSGGVPDNRGIVRASVPIDETAPATRDTLLPLDAIEHALEALGETPEHSRDPGRYICNNVMFADIAAMTGVGRAGFIHLPYTSDFDDAVRARFGKVVAAAVQAAVDAP
jgi:pyroglutamyl-peptidase